MPPRTPDVGCAVPPCSTSSPGRQHAAGACEIWALDRRRALRPGAEGRLQQAASGPGTLAQPPCRHAVALASPLQSHRCQFQQTAMTCLVDVQGADQVLHHSRGHRIQPRSRLIIHDDLRHQQWSLWDRDLRTVAVHPKKLHGHHVAGGLLWASSHAADAGCLAGHVAGDSTAAFVLNILVGIAGRSSSLGTKQTQSASVKSLHSAAST